MGQKMKIGKIMIKENELNARVSELAEMIKPMLQAGAVDVSKASVVESLNGVSTIPVVKREAGISSVVRVVKKPSCSKSLEVYYPNKTKQPLKKFYSLRVKFKL